mmetsp:Transcript_28480/g.47842  ORF Transcript_28480/g.47842 Transcript_28480/m.47842 type:complete len:530 (+) Transcript_28480:269-1858(+)|eukprot:CAMPEP_0184666460 /NCGR_PEP_ID=MMETSP0308-20130426/61832_1 /TAXON_ID=38269 /ORGANISM="Gloeochaete witrockiana, Strain SAG 46.84" /LENGTH=529 /DNA_ID=CAMNT_0027111059 /DNA_START=195 /DNA_END=1784 /DNA_ORIENTATION=+
MDSEYLKNTVGDLLAQGLAVVAVTQPKDAVEYLANWLLSNVKEKERAKEIEKFQEEQRRLQKEKADQEKRAQDARAKVRKSQLESLERISNLVETDVQALYDAVISTIMQYTKASNVYYGIIETPPEPPKDEEESPGDGEEEQREEEGGDQEGGNGGDAEGKQDTSGQPQNKFIPGNLRYVAANKDNAFMVGQMLNLDEGVTFDAFRSFEQKHIANVMTAVSVKFFRHRCVGAYLATPLVGSQPYVFSELIGADTLTPGKPFTSEEIDFIAEVARAVEKANAEREKLRVAELERQRLEREAREEQERREREEAARLLEEAANAQLGEGMDGEGDAPDDESMLETDIVEEGTEAGEQGPVEEEDSEGRRLLKAINNRIFELDMKKVAAEMRTYNVPPHGVHETLTGVYLLLGHSKSGLEEWTTIRTMVGQDLLNEIQQYDPWVKQPKAYRLNAQKAIKGLTQKEVERASKASGLLFEWVKVSLALRKQAIAQRKAALAAAASAPAEDKGEAEGETEAEAEGEAEAEAEDS